jgi:heme exporter protein B
MSLVTLFKQQVRRECLLNKRQLRPLFNFCLFFFMLIVFFPLTMPSDKSLLRMVGPGLVWVAMLLATLLSSERLFQQDYDDGVIEQWLVSGYPLSVMVMAKILVHWCLSVVSVLIFSPVIALLFDLTRYETFILILSLLCGSPAIFFLCALAAVFSTSLGQKSVLLALIVLPLTIPIMIFGSGVMMAAMTGFPVHGQLALLLGISLLFAGLLPLASAEVMRSLLVD